MARSGPGPGPGSERCFPVFPKEPAPAAQRGLWHPSGFWPDGCQGLCRKVASLRSGGRRLAVRKTIEYQIGALPCTPFPAAREFAPVGSMSLDSRVAWLPYESSSFATSRGNERYEEKNRGVICFMYYSGNPPLVAGATTSPPQAVGLWVLSHGAMSLQESIETYSVSRMGWQGNTIRKGAKRPENRVTCFPVEKVRRSRIRGAAQRLITRMLFMTYDADRLIRNADFISIAREGDTTTL